MGRGEGQGGGDGMGRRVQQGAALSWGPGPATCQASPPDKEAGQRLRAEAGKQNDYT